MIIADTDVLIDFLRGRGAFERVSFELKNGRLYTTAISAFELWAGAKGPQAKSVETLLAALKVLSLDQPCAKSAGEVRRALDEKGSTIGMADSLIVGICLENDGILLTRNKKHFERVDGLKLSRDFQEKP